MTTYLGKGCSLGLPRVPFVNCRQFVCLVISRLVLRAGCAGLYQFLIIAYLFTFQLVGYDGLIKWERFGEFCMYRFWTRWWNVYNKLVWWAPIPGRRQEEKTTTPDPQSPGLPWQEPSVKAKNDPAGASESRPSVTCFPISRCSADLFFGRTYLAPVLGLLNYTNKITWVVRWLWLNFINAYLRDLMHFFCLTESKVEWTNKFLAWFLQHAVTPLQLQGMVCVFFLSYECFHCSWRNSFFLFAFTAADVVQCGGRNMSPRTSAIVQFIFYFWSFEISVNSLRNRK